MEWSARNLATWVGLIREMSNVLPCPPKTSHVVERSEPDLEICVDGELSRAEHDAVRPRSNDAFGAAEEVGILAGLNAPLWSSAGVGRTWKFGANSAVRPIAAPATRSTTS